MNERDKIIEIIRKRLTELSGSCQTDDIPLDKKSAEIVKGFAYELTDALLKNGIGDVSEWKKRAEVESKINNRQAEILADAAFTIECRCTGLYDPECHICPSKSLDSETANPCLIEKAKQQAEREIEEEERK